MEGAAHQLPCQLPLLLIAGVFAEISNVCDPLHREHLGRVVVLFLHDVYDGAAPVIVADVDAVQLANHGAVDIVFRASIDDLDVSLGSIRATALLAARCCSEVSCQRSPVTDTPPASRWSDRAGGSVTDSSRTRESSEPAPRRLTRSADRAARSRRSSTSLQGERSSRDCRKRTIEGQPACDASFAHGTQQSRASPAECRCQAEAAAQLRRRRTATRVSKRMEAVA